jgi:Uma2 family endonuclease
VSSQTRSNWFSIDEYFALERASDRRFEYRQGEIVCMSGGSREHAAISRNVIRHLSNKLGGRCEAYGSDLAVYVPEGLPYRYADVTVVCGEARFRNINGLDALENPVLIVEVLSPATADFDRGTKFEEYKSIPEFREYLLIAQDRFHVAHRIKREDGTWNEAVFESSAAVIHLESAGVDLSLREIYEGLRLNS